MNTDNTQGGAEPSPASAGSHREPVAWAVVLADGQRIYDVYGIEEEAKAIDEAVTGNHGIIPLYRSPTLTDEELEAIANGASSLEAEAMREGLSIDATAYMRKHAATLRGLLARLS
jgi:hypothetical protein